jgi:hypothetical protein
VACNRTICMAPSVHVGGSCSRWGIGGDLRNPGLVGCGPRLRDPRAANRGAVRPLRIGICIAALGWHGDIRAIALIERLPLAGAGLVRVGGAGALGGSSGRWSGPGSVGSDMRSYSSRRPHRGDPLVLVHALALGPRGCQCSRLALRSGGSDLLVFWHGEGQTALNAAELSIS